jgi:hypothetical protein
LAHPLCRLFHFVLVAPFYTTEVPEYISHGTSPTGVVCTLQHGHCPYEVSVAFNHFQGFIRLTFKLVAQDFFYPHGVESILVRIPSCQPRIIGMIRGPQLIGCFEIESDEQGRFRARGVAVRLRHRHFIYNPRSFASTPTADKTNILSYAYTLQSIMAEEDYLDNFILPTTMSHHINSICPTFISTSSSTAIATAKAMATRLSPLLVESINEGLPYYPQQYGTRSNWLHELPPIMPEGSYDRGDPLKHLVHEDDHFLRTLQPLHSTLVDKILPPYGPELTNELIQSVMDKHRLNRQDDVVELVVIPEEAPTPPPPAVPTDLFRPRIALGARELAWSATVDSPPLSSQVPVREQQQEIDAELAEIQIDDEEDVEMVVRPVGYDSSDYNQKKVTVVNEYYITDSIYPTFMTELFSFEPERFLYHVGPYLTLAHYGSQFWPNSLAPPPASCYGRQLEDAILNLPKDNKVENDYLVSNIFEGFDQLKEEFEAGRPYRLSLPQALPPKLNKGGKEDLTDKGRIQLVFDEDTKRSLDSPVPIHAAYQRDARNFNCVPRWIRISSCYTRDFAINHSQIKWSDMYHCFLHPLPDGDFPRIPAWDVGYGRQQGITTTQRRGMADPDLVSPSMYSTVRPPPDSRKPPSNVSYYGPHRGRATTTVPPQSTTTVDNLNASQPRPPQNNQRHDEAHSSSQRRDQPPNRGRSNEDRNRGRDNNNYNDRNHGRSNNNNDRDDGRGNFDHFRDQGLRMLEESLQRSNRNYHEMQEFLGPYCDQYYQEHRGNAPHQQGRDDHHHEHHHDHHHRSPSPNRRR